MPDGSLIFDTHLDNSGLADDAKKLQESVKDTTIPVKPEVDASGIQKAIDATGPHTVKLKIGEGNNWIEQEYAVIEGKFKLISKTPIEKPVEVKLNEEQLLAEKAEYEAWKKTLSPFIAPDRVVQKPIPIKGEVEADTSNVPKQIADTPTPPIEPPVEADTKDVPNQIENTPVPPVDVPVEADTHPFRTAMAGLWHGMPEIIGNKLGNLIVSKVAEIPQAIAKQFGEALETGQTINDMSKQMGMSAQAYQEWSYVFQQTGSDISVMQRGINQFGNVADVAFNGTGKATDTARAKFTRIGVSVDQLKGKTRGEMFATVVAGLQGISDEGERAAAAQDIFGTSAAQMSGLLGITTEEMNGLVREAHDYHTVLSDEAVEASASLGDTLDKLNASFDGVANEALLAFAPAIEWGADALADLCKSVGDAIDWLGGLFTRPTNELTPEIDATSNRVRELAAEMESIDKKYSDKEIDISVNFAKGQTLVEELNTLQSKVSLTEADHARMQQISQSLVDMYPSLESYLGDGGIIDMEAAKVQELITQYAALDRQINFMMLMKNVSAAKYAAEAEYKVAQQLQTAAQADYDSAYKQQVKVQSVIGEIGLASSRFGNNKYYGGTHVNLLDQIMPSGETYNLTEFVAVLEHYQEVMGGFDPEFIANYSELFSNGSLLDASGMAAENSSVTWGIVISALNELETKAKATDETINTVTKTTFDNLTSANENVKALGATYEEATAKEEAYAKVGEEQYGIVTDAQGNLVSSTKEVTSALAGQSGASRESAIRAQEYANAQKNVWTQIKANTIATDENTSSTEGNADATAGATQNVLDKVNAVGTDTVVTNENTASIFANTGATKDGMFASMLAAEAKKKEKQATDDLADATKAMADRMAQVRQANDQQVESLGSGFEKIKKYKDQSERQEKKTLKGMGAGADSQTDYWTKYKQYQDQALANGVDVNILSEMNDGSAESLAKIEALANADAATIAELTTKYQAAADAKKAASDAMTAIDLAADSEFESIGTAGDTAIAKLDQSALAAENLTKTKQSIVDTLVASGVEIQAAWDAVEAIFTGGKSATGGSDSNSGADTGAPPAGGEQGAAEDTAGGVLTQTASSDIAGTKAVLEGAAPDFTTLGGSLEASVGSGYAESAKLAGAIKDSLDEALKVDISGFNTLGGNIAAGVAKGIVAGIVSVKNAVRTMVTAALVAGQVASETQSPSKLFADKLGKFMALGTGVGFTDTMPKVLSDIRASVSTIPTSVRPAMQNAIDYSALAAAMQSGGNRWNGSPFNIENLNVRSQSDVQSLAMEFAYLMQRQAESVGE